MHDEIVVMDVSHDSMDSTDTTDSEDMDDFRLLLNVLPAVEAAAAVVAALVSAIFCQTAGSIMCYGLFGYSKIFLFMSGDCRCRWGMTSLSAASGQIS